MRYATGWYEIEVSPVANAAVHPDGKAYVYYNQEDNAWFWKPRWGEPLRGTVTPKDSHILRQVKIDPYLTPTIAVQTVKNIAAIRQLTEVNHA